MLFSDIATFTVVRMEMIIGMLMFSASQQCVHFAVYKVAVYCCWLSQPGCKPRPQDMAFDILEGIKFLKVPRAGDNIHMRIGVQYTLVLIRSDPQPATKPAGGSNGVRLRRRMRRLKKMLRMLIVLMVENVNQQQCGGGLKKSGVCAVI